MASTVAAWPTVALGEVLRQRKQFVQIDDSLEYKRCRVQLHAQGVVLRDRVTGIEVKTKSQQVCRAGEFLVAEIDAKVGGFGIVPDELEGAIVSSHYFLFQVDESRLDRRFLDNYIRTRDFQDQVMAQGSTNYAAIRPSDVLGYTIPLPPLDEQRRIVARIKALAARIAEARGLRQAAMAEVEMLLPRVISKLSFEESAWTTMRSAVADHKGAVRTGPFGSQLLHEEFVGVGVPAIGIRNVQLNRFELNAGWFVTPEKFQELKRYQVHAGDVLATIMATIGRFCVVPDDVPAAFTTKHVLAMTMDRSVANPRFVSYMLNFHEVCRWTLLAQVEGSAQPTFNSSKVLSASIPLPPLVEQTHKVTFLDEVGGKVTAMTDLQKQTRNELDALLPSVLDKAFRGEL